MILESGLRVPEDMAVIGCGISIMTMFCRCHSHLSIPCSTRESHDRRPEGWQAIESILNEFDAEIVRLQEVKKLLSSAGVELGKKSTVAKKRSKSTVDNRRACAVGPSQRWP